MADFEALAASFEAAQRGLQAETGRTKATLLAGLRALTRKTAQVRELLTEMREIIKRTLPWKGSVFYVPLGDDRFNAHSLRTGRLMCGGCTMAQIARQNFVITGRCRANPRLPGCGRG